MGVGCSPTGVAVIDQGVGGAVVGFDAAVEENGVDLLEEITRQPLGEFGVQVQMGIVTPTTTEALLAAAVASDEVEADLQSVLRMPRAVDDRGDGAIAVEVVEEGAQGFLWDLVNRRNQTHGG